MNTASAAVNQETTFYLNTTAPGLISYNLTEIDDGSTSKSNTFTAAGSWSFDFRIPMNATVNGITYNVTGRLYENREMNWWQTNWHGPTTWNDGLTFAQNFTMPAGVTQVGKLGMEIYRWDYLCTHNQRFCLWSNVGSQPDTELVCTEWGSCTIGDYLCDAGEDSCLVELNTTEIYDVTPGTNYYLSWESDQADIYDGNNVIDIYCWAACDNQGNGCLWWAKNTTTWERQTEHDGYGMSARVWSYYYLENVTIDAGQDGSDDYTNTTLFNGTEEIDGNTTALNNYLVTCSEDSYSRCDIPQNVTSDQKGVFTVNSINITADVNISSLFTEDLGSGNYYIFDSNVTVDMNMKKYWKIVPTTQLISWNINISGIYLLNQSSSSCYVNGTSYAVSGSPKYCVYMPNFTAGNAFDEIWISDRSSTMAVERSFLDPLSKDTSGTSQANTYTAEINITDNLTKDVEIFYYIPVSRLCAESNCSDGVDNNLDGEIDEGWGSRKTSPAVNCSVNGSATNITCSAYNSTHALFRIGTSHGSSSLEYGEYTLSMVFYTNKPAGGSGGGPGGGTDAGEPACGNGVCDSNETIETCPQDCLFSPQCDWLCVITNFFTKTIPSFFGGIVDIITGGFGSIGTAITEIQISETLIFWGLIILSIVGMIIYLYQGMKHK